MSNKLIVIGPSHDREKSRWSLHMTGIICTEEGTRLSIADITFASLSGSLVLPAKYGSIVPTLDELPPRLREFVQVFHGTDGRKRVLRTNEEHRPT